MRRHSSTVAAVVVFFIFVAFFPAELWASRTRSRSVRRGRHGARHVRWNPLLRGSRDSLIRQNAEIDRLQLPRIDGDSELEDLIVRKELVPVAAAKGLRIDLRLEPSKRYCKSWTRDFLHDLGAGFNREFGGSIQLNSAVRTVEQQKKLRKRNRNAAPIEGDTASSHLAGLTVDIAKKGLSRKQHRWLESYFANLRSLGLIEVAEERRQAVFHVMVSQRYAEWREEQQLAEKR